MKKTAFIFPGQGSQSVGMLNALASSSSLVEESFSQASSVLGFDLWQLVQAGPGERLNSTEITQPAMLAADVAAYRVWQSLTALKPSVVAGHSLGEYAALVVSGALDYEEAISLVAKRGKYMQQAVPAGVGAMAAVIGLSEDKLAQICEAVSLTETVAPANFNSLGQTVIAGHKAAVEKAVERSKQAGAKIAKLIPVSVPSHSPLMQPAADLLAKALEKVTIHTPQIPVIHNYDVKSYSEAEDIKRVLVNQLTQPVQWVKTIQAMCAQGIELFVECGPGKVLTGLVKRIDRSLTALNIETMETIQLAIKASEM